MSGSQWTSIVSRPHATGTPMSLTTSRKVPRWSHGADSMVMSPPVTAAATTNVPASIRSAMTRCSAPAQPTLAFDDDRVGRRALDLGAHLLQQQDQVVDLRLARGGLDDRPALGQRRGEDGVLGAHHGHLRKADLRATQPAGRAREVVAVAVLDVRAHGAHRIDVQVDRAANDPVAARVAR